MGRVVESLRGAEDENLHAPNDGNRGWQPLVPSPQALRAGASCGRPHSARSATWFLSPIAGGARWVSA
jgi:hypothetical protein